jgi:hypothetical protein
MAGGARQVWPLIAAALATLSPPAKPANRLPDLIRLSFEAADAIGQRGSFDELAALTSAQAPQRVERTTWIIAWTSSRGGSCRRNRTPPTAPRDPSLR